MTAVDVAVVVVGGLLLERASRAVMISDDQLENYFEPALQEFTDLCATEWKTVFEPPQNLRTMVMDHVRTYLDMKRMRFGL